MCLNLGDLIAGRQQRPREQPQHRFSVCVEWGRVDQLLLDLAQTAADEHPRPDLSQQNAERILSGIGAVLRARLVVGRYCVQQLRWQDGLRGVELRSKVSSRCRPVLWADPTTLPFTPTVALR
jgi:hypothetical protein